MSYIFISYSKKDIDFARHLRHLLHDVGFAVWMDEAQLVPSQRWWPTIEHNIKGCSAFIVVMSPNSQESDWVERELLVAENAKKIIFPILYSGSPWARLANIQYEDMTSDLKSVLSIKLINSLKSTVGNTNPSSQVPSQLVGSAKQKSGCLQIPIINVLLIPLFIVIVAAIITIWPSIISRFTLAEATTSPTNDVSSPSNTPYSPTSTSYMTPTKNATAPTTSTPVVTTASAARITLERGPNSIGICINRDGDLSTLQVKFGQNESYTLGDIFSKSDVTLANQCWCIQQDNAIHFARPTSCTEANTSVVSYTAEWRNALVTMLNRNVKIGECPAKTNSIDVYSCSIAFNDS